MEPFDATGRETPRGRSEALWAVAMSRMLREQDPRRTLVTRLTAMRARGLSGLGTSHPSAPEARNSAIYSGA